jgi:hypothetical protein
MHEKNESKSLGHWMLGALLISAGCSDHVDVRPTLGERDGAPRSLAADLAENEATAESGGATRAGAGSAATSSPASADRSTSANIAAHPASASTLGYNMDYPGDWTNMPPFIDQMKNARAIRGECAGSDSACDAVAHLDLDAHGWVRSLAYRDDASRAYARVTAVLNTSNERPDIGRAFVVTWEGQGDVSVDNGGDILRDVAKRRVTFRLQPGNTVLSVSAIEPSDYPKNIRVFRADDEALLDAGEIFDPDMLSYLAPFGTVRFMDWMQSNTHGECSGGSRQGEDCYAVTDEDCGGGVCIMPGEWSQRPTADQASYQAWGQYLDNAAPEKGTRLGGYPVETMVALANRLGVSPHFNMPAHYTDEYVQQFATYVRDHLGPGIRANVEYSNEVWNWGFPQAQYAQARAEALWPGENSGWVQFSASRTDNLCKIWKDVFAGQEERVRCLISPQTGWRELAETVLDCPARKKADPSAGSCYEHVDAINITGYFSGCLHQNPAQIQSWLAQGKTAALDLAFEQLDRGGLIADCTDSLERTIDTYGFFQKLAAARGLDVYVYESGTHFEYSGDENVRQFLVDLTQDERMYTAYRKNFDAYAAAGGTTFNVWGWVAQDDAWANSESIMDKGHPKYRAITDFVEAELTR